MREYELNPCHTGILERGAEQHIEEFLSFEHRKTDVKPQHLTTGFAGESLALAPQVLRADQDYLGSRNSVLKAAEGLADLDDPGGVLLMLGVASEVAEKEQGQDNEDDGNDDALVANLQEIEEQGNNRCGDAGNSFPVDPAQLSH